MIGSRSSGKSDKGPTRRPASPRCELYQGSLPDPLPSSLVWNGDVEAFLDKLPRTTFFDLIVSSPPYNIGKPYEDRKAFEEYKSWQARVLNKLVARLSDRGSLCWQVGNYISNNQILPLDIVFHPILSELGLKLRNRIIWTFGHGLHTRRRFSGRYEVILWYTRGDDYVFNLDAVRVPSKYPGKRAYRGPKRGDYSGNPNGKNPEDVWAFDYDIWTNIPNVKSNHIEKTNHPCQFPVGLIERLVLALTKPNGLILDPFSGVASAGVAAVIHDRRFFGCEIDADYARIGLSRINAALRGDAIYRSHAKPLYDHTKSTLATLPLDWDKQA